MAEKTYMALLEKYLSQNPSPQHPGTRGRQEVFARQKSDNPRAEHLL